MPVPQISELPSGSGGIKDDIRPGQEREGDRDHLMPVAEIVIPLDPGLSVGVPLILSAPERLLDISPPD